MKLAPLPGLFSSHRPIPNTSIGILKCKFNKMKYFKADLCVRIRRPQFCKFIMLINIVY